jgi:hypothetical protein
MRLRPLLRRRRDVALHVAGPPGPALALGAAFAAGLTGAADPAAIATAAGSRGCIMLRLTPPR